MNTTSSLAETLFVEMINGDHKLSMNEVEERALSAIAFAKLFTIKTASENIQDAPTTYRLKGCRACFGSGGKVSDPCKACNGTGKVKSK